VTWLAKEIERIRKAVLPPPALTIADWADRHRYLPGEAGASPGRWRTDRAEYLRGVMEALSDPRIQDVVLMGCAQHGKTEVILNAIGFHMQHDPAPILIVQPTLPMAEAFSKDRLATMIRDCEPLTDLVNDPRSRDSGNTILHKQFRGGHVTVAGANSPASLASRPVRFVCCDEVDRYEASAGTEGDPVDLAFKRAKSFWNRKRLLTSSPTRTGSRIHKAFQKSDKRFFMVDCPRCGASQRLCWNPLSDDARERERVRWAPGDPDSAAYHCAQCDAPWSELERLAAVRAGRWVPTAKSRRRAGFHVGGLYLTWQTPAELVAEWLDVEASGSAERKRVFVNTELGEVFDDDGEHVEEGSLRARAEVWQGVPEGVYFTTAGADVQGDRIELELVGWGDQQRSWSLDYRVFTGDPASPEVWDELDRYLLDKKPAKVCIDSGGHHTQAVYKFCRARFKRRVYAIKGMAGAGRLVWPRAPSRGKGGAPVYVIGVDAAKDEVFANLKVTNPSAAGYCHLPAGREDWWYGGLTSEAVFEKHVKGIPTREYRRRPGFRNEPLDCRVYAYAALASFGKLSWAHLARKRARTAAAAAEERASAQPAEIAEPEAPSSDPPREPQQIERKATPIKRRAAPPQANWVRGNAWRGRGSWIKR
jgi:phage terminase large subunit GpA-like protein